MENALIILGQVAVMALMALAGFILVRAGKLDPGVTVGISNLLIYVVLPCIVIGSMQRDFDAGEARLLLAAFALSALSYAVCIVFAQLLLRRGKGRPNAGLERFVAVLPNTGYIGIPLVQAVLGEDGVFFLTAYIVLFNLIMFSYGRYQLSKDGEERGLARAARPFSPESLLRSAVNPATIGVAAGALLYVLRIRLPFVLTAVVQGFSGLNSVLSMVLIGIFLSQTDFRRLAHFSRGLMLCLLRLMALPVLVMLALAPLDLSALGEQAALVKTTIVIAASTPASVASSFMGELCGADNLYGANLVVVSTVLSVVTMPLMLLLWNFLSAAL